MREFAQSISGELKRRAELLGGEGAYEELTAGASRPGHRIVTPRHSPDRDDARAGAEAAGPSASSSTPSPHRVRDPGGPETLHGTLRLRTLQAREDGSSDSSAGRSGEPAGRDVPAAAADAFVQHLDAQSVPGPRLVILVDDFDTLVDPALGNPGRPAAGSVVRALEAVARDGARLGMHIVAASSRPDRTAGTVLSQAASLRAELWRGGRRRRRRGSDPRKGHSHRV